MCSELSCSAFSSNMAFSFAYVRYVNDNVRTIVKLSAIKNFKPPQNIKDLDKAKVHDVFWPGQEDGSDAGYYKAQILLLADTEEQLQDQINHRRVHVPKVMEHDNDTDESAAEEDVSNVLKEKKKNEKESSWKAMRAILERKKKEKRMQLEKSTSSHNMGTNKIIETEDTECIPHLSDPASEPFSKRCQERRHGEKLPMKTVKRRMSEELPPAKKRQCTTEISTDSSDDELIPKSKLTEIQNRYDKLQQTYSALLQEHNKIKDLNIKLQECILEKFSTQNASISLPMPDSIPCDNKCQSERKENLHHNSLLSRDDFPSDLALTNTVGSAVLVPPTQATVNNVTEVSVSSHRILEEVNKQVHLGENIWIPIQKWQMVQNMEPSLFVKSLAVAIWGSSELSTRSVLGIPCNRIKSGSESRKALTPTKLNVIRSHLRESLTKRSLHQGEIEMYLSKLNRYLSEKINDIRKQKKHTS